MVLVEGWSLLGGIMWTDVLMYHLYCPRWAINLSKGEAFEQKGHIEGGHSIPIPVHIDIASAHKEIYEQQRGGAFMWPPYDAYIPPTHLQIVIFFDEMSIYGTMAFKRARFTRFWSCPVPLYGWNRLTKMLATSHAALHSDCCFQKDAMWLHQAPVNL